jgi:hypothetical protein
MIQSYFATPIPEKIKSHKSTSSEFRATKLNPFLNVNHEKDKMTRHHFVIGAVFSSGTLVRNLSVNFEKTSLYKGWGGGGGGGWVGPFTKTGGRGISRWGNHY